MSHGHPVRPFNSLSIPTTPRLQFYTPFHSIQNPGATRFRRSSDVFKDLEHV
jgi:hypothetical protein